MKHVTLYSLAFLFLAACATNHAGSDKEKELRIWPLAITLPARLHATDAIETGVAAVIKQPQGLVLLGESEERYLVRTVDGASGWIAKSHFDADHVASQKAAVDY